MPDPNNPLSYIGASNDPSLTQRTVDTNRSLQEMRRNLGQIASQSGYDRSLEGFKAGNASALAKQNNLASLIRGYLTQGIDLPGHSGGRMGERYATDTIAKQLANIAAADAVGAGPFLTPGMHISELAASDPITLPTTPSGERVARAGQPVTTFNTGTSGKETITNVQLEGDTVPSRGPKKVVTETATKEGTRVKDPSTIGRVTDAGLRNRLIADVVRQGKKIETIAAIDDVGPSQWRISFNDGSPPIYATKPTAK